MENLKWRCKSCGSASLCGQENCGSCGMERHQYDFKNVKLIMEYGKSDDGQWGVKEHPKRMGRTARAREVSIDEDEHLFEGMDTSGSESDSDDRPSSFWRIARIVFLWAVFISMTYFAYWIIS